ncbi:MAG: SDR family NAD(P)-dependent oxidoreductase [Marinilabiliaceae bacterium]|nr:SDR family NAD(P)-dependent oxidoreductase [Marinilabiliaceae bacterium]
MNKIALITGTTSGIGEATAKNLAKIGYDLIITGRRKDRLDILKTSIIKECNNNVLQLCFDIRNTTDVLYAINSLPESWQNIDVLINNAGLAAGFDPVDKALWEDWETMIDTNVKGLLYLSRQIIPLMKKRQKGHIINISSIAGINTYANGSVYCASKHAVNAITEGMRIDLLPYNIKVSSISPGAVETEFSNVRFKGDDEAIKKIYKGFTPLNANDIADTIKFIITRPDHVNINDILIMPTRQANSYYTFRD